jgi:ABC-type transporter MlaC component
MKSIITAALLAVAATAVFAQASAPAAASSTVRQKIAKKYKAAKAKHPPASAVNPEASADKKGGN